MLPDARCGAAKGTGTLVALTAGLWDGPRPRTLGGSSEAANVAPGGLVLSLGTAAVTHPWPWQPSATQAARFHVTSA